MSELFVAKIGKHKPKHSTLNCVTVFARRPWPRGAEGQGDIYEVETYFSWRWALKCARKLRPTTEWWIVRRYDGVVLTYRPGMPYTDTELKESEVCIVSITR